MSPRPREQISKVIWDGKLENLCFQIWLKVLSDNRYRKSWFETWLLWVGGGHLSWKFLKIIIVLTGVEVFEVWPRVWTKDLFLLSIVAKVKGKGNTWIGVSVFWETKLEAKTGSTGVSKSLSHTGRGLWVTVIVRGSRGVRSWRYRRVSIQRHLR
jgi:hypothetical protein